jgi:SAM-dependent methyltransferase
MKIIFALSLLFCSFLVMGQEKSNPMGHSHANEHMHKSDFESLVARFENPERDRWQKPDLVVAMLGDLTGKTVMDLGSGTGYFTFRMFEAGARVIAADVDERFLSLVKEKQATMPRMAVGGVETRLVPYDSPSILPGELDIFFTVNTYHHIEDRVAYLKQVHQGLKSGGKAVIVDFFKADLPVGPPMDIKLSEEQVKAELLQAGFTDVRIDTQSLFYQYIITAR